MVARRVFSFTICAVGIGLAHGQGPDDPAVGIVYVSFEPPPPTLRVVMLTPSDLEPPHGFQRRINQVADANERFLVNGMKRWGYAPANERIFRRDARGSVEVLRVKGEYRASSGRYRKPNFAADVVARATRRYRILGGNHVWWIFTYLGDPPRRIDEYRGSGDLINGGWAIVNYSTLVGEIRPDLGLMSGFNGQFTLKGCIHELGHALGLPHIGPNPGLGLGNSLMGPNNDVYAGRKLPHADQVHLTEAAAAMLWKHPIFSGTARDRALRPTVELTSYHARYSRQENRVSIKGTLTSDLPAHTAVILDDRGRPRDEYWFRGYARRLSADQSFDLEIDDPAKADGHYRIVFCFDNGAVAGDDRQAGYFGAIVKSYRFRDGRYQFGK